MTVYRSKRWLTAALSVLFVGLLVFIGPGAVQPAFADSGDDSASSSAELTDYLPAETRLAVNVNIDNLRQSKYYDQLLTWLEERSGDSDLVSRLEDNEELALKSKMKTLSFGVPTADFQSRQKVETFTMAMAGDFKRDAVVKAAKEELGELEEFDATDSMKGWRADGFEFAFPADGVLMVVGGPDDYRKGAWKTAKDGQKSFTATLSSSDMLDGIETDKTMWVVNRPAAKNKNVSKIEHAAFSVELASGLKVQLSSKASTEQAAKAMADQVKAMQKTAANNPMLAMVGATPLVTNLDFSRDGAMLKATTSLSEAELDTLLEKAKQFGTSSKRNFPGAGSNSSDDSGTSNESNTKEDDASSSEDDNSKDDNKGIEADFN